MKAATLALFVLCVLWTAVLSAQAPPSDGLTAEETKAFDGMKSTWDRLAGPIAELEKDPKIQRYLALLQLRAELQKDLETFAGKVLADRKLKPPEAYLDMQARKVVRRAPANGAK